MDKKFIRGSITPELLKENKKILHDLDAFEEWITLIKDIEPEYYEWMQHASSFFINDIGENVRLTFNDGRRLGHHFLLAFSFGYMIYYNMNRSKVEKLLQGETQDKQFDMWLDGKLPGKWYRFPLKGLNKNSSAYKAKQKFLLRRKKLKKELELQATKAQFYEISKEVENISDDEDLVTDDDLRIFNNGK